MKISRPIRYMAMAAATLMSFAPVSANAAQHHTRHHRHPYYAGAPQPRSYCAPWCPTDYSPCDPTYFKIADGRCDDWR